MAVLSNLTVNITGNTSNLATALKSASVQVNTFSTSMNKTISSSLVDTTADAKIEFKKVSRIIQGIVVSQVFYRGLQAIQSATSAVWEFSNALEYAEIAYSSLFGDAELAEEFINVLQDFAAVTPFSFTESEDAAKKLLAYGVEAENVMYIMEGILAASSAQGSSDAISSISKTIGQIYTKGRLMSEEMVQLAEAGIPAYEILSEALGLSQEQLQNLGDESIDAATAINALIDGMTERYGNVTAAASTTTTGIISNIQDISAMIAAELADPMIEAIKSFLSVIGEELATLQDILGNYGIGGMFEYIVPEELQDSVRLLIANMINLGTVIKDNVVSIFNVLKAALYGVSTAFTVISIPMIFVMDILGKVTLAVSENAQAMSALTKVVAVLTAVWVVYKAKALAAWVATKLMLGVVAVTKAFAALLGVLSTLVIHPFWTLAIVAAGAIAALVIGVDNLSAAMTGLLGKISALSGADPGTLLNSEETDRAADLEKFSEALDTTADSMDNLAESTEEAVSGLLSFDEVFSLDDEENDIDDTTSYDIPDISYDLDSLLPSTEDVTSAISTWVGNFVDTFIDYIINGSIGALVGGAIGTALLGPGLGTALGAVVGTVAGLVWTYIADELGISESDAKELLGPPIIAGVLAGLAGAAALVAGGATITASALLATAVATALAGAIAGLAAGYISDKLNEYLAEEFNRTTEDINNGSVGQAIGGVTGALVGALLGGPIGAVIGIMAGTVLGGTIGLFWSDITEVVGKAATDISGSMSTAATDISGFFSSVSEASGNAGGALAEFVNSVNSNVASVTQVVSTELSTTWGNITTFFSDVQTASGEAGANFAIFLGEVSSSVTSFFSTKASELVSFLSTMLTTIASWISSVLSGVATFFSNLQTASANAGAALATFVNSASSTVSSFASGLAGYMSTGLSSMYSAVSSGLSNVLSLFTSWVSSIWSNVFSSLFSWIDSALSSLSSITGFSTSSSVSYSSYGHAAGGVFNQEHLASFAEGNKAEAIIPLENDSAMQPFVDAVANGLYSTLAPLMSSVTSSQGASDLRPLYVGTLIADDAGLQELNTRMNVIELQKSSRRLT